MNTTNTAGRLAALVLGLGMLMPPALSAAAPTAEDPATQVRAAFDAWRVGTGTVFDLLADDVVWTVAGDSPVSGVYRTREAFLRDAVAPITARLATPIVPELHQLIAHDDHVVAIWEGRATALDGRVYRNHYAWHMRFEGGRIVEVVAFLDTWALARLME